MISRLRNPCSSPSTSATQSFSGSQPAATRIHLNTHIIRRSSIQATPSSSPAACQRLGSQQPCSMDTHDGAFDRQAYQQRSINTAGRAAPIRPSQLPSCWMTEQSHSIRVCNEIKRDRIPAFKRLVTILLEAAAGPEPGSHSPDPSIMLRTPRRRHGR